MGDAGFAAQQGSSEAWRFPRPSPGVSGAASGDLAPAAGARETSSLEGKIHFLAQFKQRPVTLQELHELGLNPTREALLREAQFLYQELPIRLSHRVVELESLPFGLAQTPSVRLVRGMYLDAVRELIDMPLPSDVDEGRRFVRALETLKQRHGKVVPLMAKGLLELKASQDGALLKAEIHEFLDRFFISRIGLRMLAGQHIALHEKKRPGFVGLICEKCSPLKVAREAVVNARNLCLLHYGKAPEVGVLGNVDLTFTYVPSHLHHMLFELLKNSMRAVVELCSPDAKALPMIRIALAEGNEDVTIKISDEGGGIPRSDVPRIWSYLYTTAKPPLFSDDSPYTTDFHAPFAGLGYGLPISRLYARYFGGDLQILSMEGYGADAYLHLKRLGDTKETVPRKLC